MCAKIVNNSHTSSPQLTQRIVKSVQIPTNHRGRSQYSAQSIHKNTKKTASINVHVASDAYIIVLIKSLIDVIRFCTPSHIPELVVGFQ